jgi:hypothetical protein
MFIVFGFQISRDTSRGEAWEGMHAITLQNK